jgi:hypothetical protein
VNDDGACARCRAAIAATRSRAREQIVRACAEIVARFSACKKCPWNGRFLIVSFCIAIERAHARAKQARTQYRRVATFETGSTAAKFFLHRARAKALAMTESHFERANQ